MSQKYIFKSKYRDDQISLTKGTVTTRPDGSRLIEGQELAQFANNTFTTYDAALADKLRQAIKDRKSTASPLQVFETTDLKEVVEELAAEKATQPKVTKGVRASKGA